MSCEEHGSADETSLELTIPTATVFEVLGSVSMSLRWVVKSKRGAD